MVRLSFLYPIRPERAALNFTGVRAALSFAGVPALLHWIRTAAAGRAALIPVLVLWLLAVGSAVQAEDRLVRLAVPQALIETGFLKHLLPRFSLKTQVRIELVTPGAAAEAAFSDRAEGTPVFQDVAALWHMQVLDGAHPGTARFVDWLGSDVGARTITAYAPDGVQMFTLPQITAEVEEEIVFEGDAMKGQNLSRSKCGRCHAVAEDMRMTDIGSTPSFFVLRALPDWDYRFQAFYALNPHPSFTQVADVTEPFPADRPSPIVPVAMTLDELEAILAYVSSLTPADLGAPLQHQ